MYITVETEVEVDFRDFTRGADKDDLLKMREDINERLRTKHRKAFINEQVPEKNTYAVEIDTLLAQICREGTYEQVIRKLKSIL